MNRISPHHVRRESEDRREQMACKKFDSPEKQVDPRRSNTPENTSWYIEMTLQLYSRSEVVEINSRKQSIPPFDLSASTKKAQKEPATQVSEFDDWFTSDATDAIDADEEGDMKLSERTTRSTETKSMFSIFS